MIVDGAALVFVVELMTLEKMFQVGGRLIYGFPLNLRKGLNNRAGLKAVQSEDEDRDVLDTDCYGFTSEAGSEVTGAGWASVENQEDMADLALVNAPPTD